MSARSSSGRAEAPRSPSRRGLAVFLASAASDGITGKLISAPWDPWEELGDHAEDLRGSDVYTLRRIVPGDRGLEWGSGTTEPRALPRLSLRRAGAS